MASEEIITRAVSVPVVKETRDNKKIRVLWYSDFLVNTGFGTVAQQIMKRLMATGDYEFEVVAINYHGEAYNIKGNPFSQFKDVPIWSAAHSRSGDSMFGHRILADRIANSKFDILFVMQDSFNLIPMKEAIEEARKVKQFKYVLYFPVDGGVRADWVSNAIKVADYPIVYTEYGRNEVARYSDSINLGVLYHGVDPREFSPFSSQAERTEFRKNYFKCSPDEPDRFVITNVNRNQPRKDIPRTILAFAELLEKRPDINAYLYLHCQISDGAGINLQNFSTKNIPKYVSDRIMYPSVEIMAKNGYPVEVLRKIYAASDVVISTTLGEGFGLSTIEAMACKTPVAMPRNSALVEILGEKEERGYLVDSGTTRNLHVSLKHDFELLRPLVDINHLVSVLERIYENPNEAKEKAEVAYKWAQEHSWDNIVSDWDRLLKNVYSKI